MVALSNFDGVVEHCRILSQIANEQLGRIMSNFVRLSRIMSDFVGLCRFMSDLADLVGFCRILSDSVGLCRIIGFCRIMSDLSDFVGFCRTLSDPVVGGGLSFWPISGNFRTNLPDFCNFNRFSPVYDSCEGDSGTS